MEQPKKYGPRPGFTRKRVLKFERRQIEREIKARMAAEAQEPRARRDVKTLIDTIASRLDEIKSEESMARSAAGWTELGCGVSVPPGWVWTGEGDPAEWVAEDSRKRNAVYSSSNSSTSPANLSPGPSIA